MQHDIRCKDKNDEVIDLVFRALPRSACCKLGQGGDIVQVPVRISLKEIGDDRAKAIESVARAAADAVCEALEDSGRVEKLIAMGGSGGA